MENSNENLEPSPAPEMSEVQKTPDAPEAQNAPGMSEAQKTPGTSETQNTPDAPETSIAPTPPGAPKTPTVPGPQPQIEPPVAPKSPAQPEPPVAPKSPAQPESPVASPAKPTKKALVLLITAIFILAAGCLTLVFTTMPTSQNDIIQTTLQPEERTKTEEVPKSELQLAGVGLSDFDLAFLKLEEDSTEVKNKVYSPLSIKYALSMLAYGANGTSRDQIISLLGSYRSKSYSNNAHRSLANVFFVHNEIKNRVLPAFTENLKTAYSADVIFDSFTSAANVNSWINNQTLGQIDNLLTDEQINDDVRFLLINALAIDMDWNHKLQCSNIEKNSAVPNIFYEVRYRHEKYSDLVSCLDAKYQTATFNGQEVQVGQIGASINNYDIIKELGEDKIRATVTAAYEEWKADELAETKKNLESATNSLSANYYQEYIDALEAKTTEEAIDEYMTELGENYGQSAFSTDFSYYVDDSVKVFAKDLQEYDGVTLQYVGIMPVSTSLEKYVKNVSASKLTSLISKLKSPTNADSKQGVVTKITGTIPFFNFDYDLDLMKDLKTLGMTDVFSEDDADLSNMLTTSESDYKIYVLDALHKANIDFSNTGIKASAATVIVGGRGAAGGGFDYLWDVPVEEIDLTFDQPFLFLIRDKDTGEIWFTGEVYEGKLE